jgi:hypothetical protein
VTQARAISHFLIERELGRGGMGVVYQGLDTRLNRTVAIKSLPPEVAADVRWRTRFEAEAKTLAQINHPNIAAIYGIETDETGYYLILEMADGPTLDERLSTQGPELREALAICRQVALGISAAHARGIIHRDLKPGNIKLRPDGVVKVLDFGIAKSAHAESGPTDANQPTVIAVRVNPVSTIPGFMMGTPGYMAPEQARGRPVNQATDLWALGCVLFECLSHKMAFPGETLADAIAVTLMGQPDFAALPARTPARVVKLLQTCLAKDQRERALSMAQAAAVLEEAERDVSATSVMVKGASSETDTTYDAEPGNLPAYEDALLGRDALLQQLALEMKRSRLVTLTGAVGAGSSRVAAKAAALHHAQFRSGIWWIALPHSTDATTPAVLAALAVKARGTVGNVTEALRERIAGRVMLLVFDGCSTAPAPTASLILDLLRACPNLQVLSTARSPLGLSGETIVGVGPLPCDGQGAIHAAEVLIARAHATAPSFAATPESIESRVADWFGGNPLAIELAAPLAASMPLEAFETQLRLRAGLTGAASPASIGPDQLCRVLAAWAIETMAPSPLAVLLRASAFVGSWSIRAAAAAGGAKDSMPTNDSPFGPSMTAAEQRLLDQLTRLKERGLVQRLPGPDAPTRPAFTLPQAVRTAAQDRLKETPAAETVVLSGYRNYLLALADAASLGLSGPSAEAFASRLESEYADLAHAAHAPGPEAARVQTTLTRLLNLRGLA